MVQWKDRKQFILKIVTGNLRGHQQRERAVASVLANEIIQS